MATPYIVGVGASTNGASGNVTPPQPTGWGANDIHICCINTGDNVAVTMPAGWTSKVNTTNTANQRRLIFWRRAVAGDTDPLITHTAGDGIVAQIVGLRNCLLSGDPLELAEQVTAVANATVTAATLTPSVDGVMLLYVTAAVRVADTSVTLLPPVYVAGYPQFTALGAGSENAGSPDLVMLHLANAVQFKAAATGARTVTLPQTALSIGTLIAVKGDPAVPEPGGGTFDDRFRFRDPVLLSHTSTLGTRRSHWPADARDFGRLDAIADNRSRGM